jgi:hypothetical protein
MPEPSRPTLIELTIADPPEVWAALGFTVDGAWCRVGSVRIRLAGRGTARGVVAWGLSGLDGETDVDGVPTTAAPSEPSESVDHPNGASVIDHVVLLSPDLARTTTALEAIGLDVRRVREVPPEQYSFAARQVFFRAGEVIVEMIGPVEPDPARADRPARFYGLAITVDDIDALAEQLGDLVGPVKDAVQPGRRIATLRHQRADLTTAIAFMSPGPTAV